MDYASLFRANPTFLLANMFAARHQSPTWADEQSERIALWMLRKSLEQAYASEADG